MNNISPIDKSKLLLDAAESVLNDFPECSSLTETDGRIVFHNKLNRLLGDITLIDGELQPRNAIGGLDYEDTLIIPLVVKVFYDKLQEEEKNLMLHEFISFCKDTPTEKLMDVFCHQMPLSVINAIIEISKNLGK